MNGLAGQQQLVDRGIQRRTGRNGSRLGRECIRPIVAFESGVNGTSNVPEAPNRKAAKLELGYSAVTSFTACFATSRRLDCSAEPYCASLTAMEPVTSTATTTSVAFTARLLVGATILGVNAMTDTVRQSNTRRTHAQTVSSLSARRRTCNTICAMAQASRTTATAPPTGQPKAGESVRWFISSTSKPMPARPSKRWPRPVSTIREHPPWRPCCSTRFHGSAEIRFP